MVDTAPDWWPAGEVTSMEQIDAAGPRVLRERWAAASTLQDLADCLASFLAGDLRFNPFYGFYQPDAETRPIIDRLVAANRAGLATDSSQPGRTTRHWAQRAFVSGIAEPDLVEHLRQGLADTDLAVFVAPLLPPDRALDLMARIPVTLQEGRPVTWAGCRVGVEDIFPGIGEHTALTATTVGRCWSVQLVDPVWGREDHLWDAFSEALVP